jgi:hypothetical protein
MEIRRSGSMDHFSKVPQLHFPQSWISQSIFFSLHRIHFVKLLFVE